MVLVLQRLVMTVNQALRYSEIDIHKGVDNHGFKERVLSRTKGGFLFSVKYRGIDLLSFELQFLDSDH